MSMLKPANFSPSQSLASSRKIVRAGLSTMLLGLFTSGCAFWQTLPAVLPPNETPAAVTKSSPAVLSEAAAATLEKARLQVADAKRTRTLWKSAAEKMSAAELAATNQDSASTIRFSNEVISLCEQSRAQSLRPPISW
jgi:hypothetical protein